MQVVVAQKGAREHFLAARALYRRGNLAKLVVDWYAPQNSLLQWMISCARGAASRAALAAESREIPNKFVWPIRFHGLLWKWKERMSSRRGSPYDGFLQTDAAFAKTVSGLELPPHEVFFGYSYSSLEALQVERARGVLTILAQIDPGPVEFRLVAEEMARHPELAGWPKAFPAAYFARVKREWEIARVVVVNSEWSRDALVSEGVDPAKVEILPLAYEAEEEARGTEDSGLNRKYIRRKKESGCFHSTASNFQPALARLRVLWLGQVNVRKGIHYLIEAARLLQSEAVEFAVAGPLSIRPEVVARSPTNIRWLGAVPRSQAAALYRESQVFVLPTLSDGFALTQLEAMAYGLPVVTTPNCGIVVQDGITGFIIPPRDPEALAEAIRRFVQYPALVAEMSPKCRQAAAKYSIEAYGERLLEIIQKHSGRG